MIASPVPRLMLMEKRVSIGPLLPVRWRSATSTHCRTLPSGPVCGSALQVPLGERACWPAAGLPAGAARAGVANVKRVASAAAMRPECLVNMVVACEMTWVKAFDARGRAKGHGPAADLRELQAMSLLSQPFDPRARRRW